MSTSFCVDAVVSGKDHQAKCKAYRACENAGIEIPKELIEYFGSSEERPDPRGILKEISFTEQSNSERECWEIIVESSDLPPGTTKIIFSLHH